MPITGGIKFFDKSRSLLVDGASISSITSGSATEDNMIDKNPLTRWQSLGSDDSTLETIEVTLPAATLIDRIFLIDHNFKEFNVKYDSGGFTDFASVVGLDGTPPGPGIAETGFGDTTAYYEFTPVTTTKLQIQCLKTQIVDAQKFLGQFIVMTELGTLVGFPRITGLQHTRNERKSKMLSGKTLVQKSEESLRFGIDYRDFPPSLVPDLDLAMTLFERDEDFLVWLCGGRRGVDFFRYTLRGFRLEDVRSVNTASPVQTSYRSNVYTLPVRVRLKFEQSV